MICNETDLSLQTQLVMTNEIDQWIATEHKCGIDSHAETDCYTVIWRRTGSATPNCEGDLVWQGLLKRLSNSQGLMGGQHLY